MSLELVTVFLWKTIEAFGPLVLGFASGWKFSQVFGDRSARRRERNT